MTSEDDVLVLENAQRSSCRIGAACLRREVSESKKEGDSVSFGKESDDKVPYVNQRQLCSSGGRWLEAVKVDRRGA